MRHSDYLPRWLVMLIVFLLLIAAYEIWKTVYVIPALTRH